MVEAILGVAHPRYRRDLEVGVWRSVRGVIDLVLHDQTQPVSIATEVHSQIRRAEQQIRWANEKADALAALPEMAGRQVARLLVLRNSRRTERWSGARRGCSPLLTREPQPTPTRRWSARGRRCHRPPSFGQPSTMERAESWRVRRVASRPAGESEPAGREWPAGSLPQSFGSPPIGGEGATGANRSDRERMVEAPRGESRPRPSRMGRLGRWRLGTR
jgi:hypothetical protein